MFGRGLNRLKASAGNAIIKSKSASSSTSRRSPAAVVRSTLNSKAAAAPLSSWTSSKVTTCYSISAAKRPQAIVASSMRFYSDDSGLPEHHKVNLPALSPTMEMGTIVSWEKKVGDQVSEGDLLCEIETDKATMGFETPEEGYLAKVILPAGSKDIPIGRLLCIITANEEDVAKFKDYQPPLAAIEAAEDKAAAKATSSIAPEEPIAPKMTPIKPTPPPPQPSVVPAAAGGGAAKRAFASPAAKRVAAERGVDIQQITSGSGMDGMITVKDVEAFVPPAAAAPAMATAPATATATAPTFRSSGGAPAMMGSGYSDADVSNMRRVIAKRLQTSKHEVPHYYLTVDVEMDAVMKLRQEINANYEKEGVKVSVNDFIIKATALACRQVPAVNSHWMDTFIREHHTCDVSVAVDTGNGLITPIVTSAEAKGLAEISHSVREMAGRAKEGKLQPHEFQGGTITVSNLGMFGISHFTAIINSPQSCILAVGETKAKVIPVGQEGATKVAKVMSVTLSCDHRVVDGAVGAQWLQKFKKFVEQPTSMLL